MKKFKAELMKIRNTIALQEKIVKSIIQSMGPKTKPVARKQPRVKKKGTDVSVVLKAMSRAKKGSSIEVLISKTGFERKKVNNLIYLAINKKLVERVGRGIYKKLQ